MLVTAIFLSLVFILLGSIVTANNAKYILSGYNTMSESDRAKMDVAAYLRFFKKFHLFLGISLLTGFLILSRLNHNWASAFIILYPLLAYAFLLAQGNVYYHGTKGQKAGTYVGIAIILVIAIGTGTTLFSSFRNSEIKLVGDQLRIEGMYGFKIEKSQITELNLAKNTPEIEMKTNGFAAGDYAKGSFKTSDGRNIKLFVNKTVSPYLLIRTNSEEIYFSSDEVSSAEMYLRIKYWTRE